MVMPKPLYIADDNWYWEQYVHFALLTPQYLETVLWDNPILNAITLSSIPRALSSLIRFISFRVRHLPDVMIPPSLLILARYCSP